MTGRICVFGDSNTHGTPPMSERGGHARFGAEVRWPGVLRGTLGPGWEVIEEGLPGRTAGWVPDPEMGAATNGLLALEMAIRSHGALDHLLIMLGTNDTKAHFGQTAAAIAGHVAGLLSLARSPEMVERHGGARITLICPPRVQEVGVLQDVFFGAADKAAALPGLYAAIAAANGIAFFDADAVISVSETDGVHFGASAHRTLGRALAAHVRDLG